MSPSDLRSPWYAQAWFRKFTLSMVVAVALVQGYVAVFLRQNDFAVHREAGGAFLSGEPYGLGQDTYPPGRLMMNAALALAPVHLARAVCYGLAVLTLFACYRMWRRLASAEMAGFSGLSFAAMTAAALTLFPFVLRDLDECGLHIYLLFFLTAGGYALAAGRPAQSGFWLATATTYKVAPVLFLPYLLWKRQFKAASWMAVFVALWALAPACFVGLDKTLECHGRWAARVATIGALRDAYPSQGEIEPPRVINLSVHALVARYLQTYPEGHALVLDHPAFVQFGNLEPEYAYYAVRAALVALSLVLAWRFRGLWPHREGRNHLAAEWAAVCLLCAIVAPVCWKQHLVAAAPAVFLGWRAVLSGGAGAKWRMGILAAATVIILLSRHFVVGRELSMVLLSYKVDTVAMLMVLGLVLTLPRCRSADVASNAHGTVLPAPAARAA